MKTKILYFALFICTIIAVASLTLCVKTISDYKNQKREYSDFILSENEKDTIRARNEYLEFLTNGIRLPDSTSFENPDGQVTTLKNICAGQAKVLIYLDQTHCSACYISILKKIQSNYESILKKELFVLCSFTDYRSILVIFNELHLKANLVRIIDPDFELPALLAKSPFLMVIDENYLLNSCCIPLKDNLNKVDSFLKAYRIGYRNNENME